MKLGIWWKWLRCGSPIYTIRTHPVLWRELYTQNSTNPALASTIRGLAMLSLSLSLSSQWIIDSFSTVGTQVNLFNTLLI